jgi:hypothetical protein
MSDIAAALLTPAEVDDSAKTARRSTERSAPAVRLNDGRGALRIPADELAAWLYADPKETTR